MGERKQTKGRGEQATKKASPPCGHHSDTVSRQPAGQAPAGYLFRRVIPCCLRLRRGDARGGAPCIRKPKVSPFPGGEGGWGDGGSKVSLRQGQGGDKEGKPPPPCGHHSGTVSRQPTGQAPVGYLFRRVSPCCLRLSPGDARGEAPCIRKPKVSPFPPGRALCERGSGVYPSPSGKGGSKAS